MGYFNSPYMFNIMEMVMNGVAMNADSFHNDSCEPDVDSDIEKNDAKPAEGQIAYTMHGCLYCGAIIPEGRDICPRCEYELTPKIEGE